MKKAYSIIANTNIEIIKISFIFLLILLYQPVYKGLTDFLFRRFTWENILYMGRLLFIALFCILLALVKVRFSAFAGKNWESLILTGISTPKIFLLFFSTSYGALFLMLYFGSLLCRIMEINACSGIILNAALVYIIGILIDLKASSRALTVSAFVSACILAAFMVTGILSYHTVFRIIISDAVLQILFSCSVFSFFVKFVFTAGMSLAVVYVYRKTGAVSISSSTPLHQRNRIGDLAHKLSRYPISNQNYFRMYRSRDFILWKLFSSTVFLFLSLALDDSLTVCLWAYGILLISAFYYCDIYGFERNHLLLYHMSAYPYRKHLWNFAISGILLLGDNMLLILLIRCFIHPDSLLILPFILFAAVFTALFINSHLYAKYPLKQYPLSVCLALAKMHLPILNIVLLYKSIKHGKKNWENLNWENMNHE